MIKYHMLYLHINVLQGHAFYRLDIRKMSS